MTNKDRERKFQDWLNDMDSDCYLGSKISVIRNVSLVENGSRSLDKVFKIRKRDPKGRKNPC